MNNSSDELMINDLSTNEEEQGQEEFEKEWESTHVETVFAVKSSEVQSKRLEIEQAFEEMQTNLAHKEINLMKQVRGITSECGQMRIEVGWLEHDLSKIKEERRHNLLEIQAITARQRLEIEQSITEGNNIIYNLKKELHEAQCDSLTKIKDLKKQMELSDNDINAQIAQTNAELDDTRIRLLRANRKYDTMMTETSSSIDMLHDELETYNRKFSNVDSLLEQESKKLQKLELELAQAEGESETVKNELEHATKEREINRQKVMNGEELNWKNTLESLKRPIKLSTAKA